ncbi:MAG: hypothetical protein HFJ50_03280 [Clostridia bacterium]|nr:hypothetical protein [Clostridia bacterium]
MINTVRVEKGVTNEVEAILSEDASFFVKKSNSANITQNITFKEDLCAPIAKGDVIGNVSFTLDNETIKTINIVAKNDVKKKNLFNMTLNLYKNWFNVLR